MTGTDPMDDDDALELKPLDLQPSEPRPGTPLGARRGAHAADSASPGGPNIDPLVARLRHEADQAQAGGMASVGGGVAICVIGSLLLGLVIAGLCSLWFDSTILGILGWSIVLLLACGAVVALALKPAAASNESGRYVAGAPPELLARGALDWPLLGPRMLAMGIRHAQGSEPITRGYFYDRCALLLRQLGKRGEQAPVASMLISDDETPAMLGKVISYLDRTGWLGASSDKQRVWLSSKARTVLTEMGVVPDTALR